MRALLSILLCLALLVPQSTHGARSFTASSSEYLQVSAAAVSAYSVTMCAWFYVTDLSSDRTIVSIADTASANNYWEILVRTTGEIRAREDTSSTANVFAATTSTSTTTNVWAHACGIFNSATDRRAFLNGGGKGTSANNQGLPNSLDTTAIGRRTGSSPTQYFNGRIAEVTIWSAALTDGEIAALGAGAHPYTVRPTNIAGYWPLWTTDTGVDLSGVGNHMAATGTSTADHAPISRRP